MRIVYLAAGAAGMYCGSCLHDNALAAALLARGADLLLVPTYTPLRTDEPDVSQPLVMLGGLNMYLQQASALFRHTPRWLDRWFDSPRLLAWLSRLQSSVDAGQLGALACSILQGEAGRQRKEMARLADWIVDEVRPDVVHLSNTLLSGVAPAIRRRRAIPVVSTLSGEDIFLDGLVAPYRDEAQRLLREQSRSLAACVALNHYFADAMAGLLDFPRERIAVVRHGLNVADFAAHPAHRTGPFKIGYFARVCPAKGLHQLVEAVSLLARDGSLPAWRVRAGGYLGAGDQAYFREVHARVAAAGWAERFEFVGEVDRAAKLDFFQSLDCLALPTVYRESKGLSAIEALAAAVPVVLPAHGAFPELVEDTGGGVLVPPGDAAALAEALRRYLTQPALADEHGRQGRAAVGTRYTAESMADEHLALYRGLVASGASAAAATP